MKIFVGADHRGFAPKGQLIAYLQKAGYDVEDIGDKQFDPEDDFPLFASTAANKVLTSEDNDPRAILICGSGQGMAIAANRFKGIRAGLGWSIEAAKSTRNDEDSNVLALPAEHFEGKNPKALAIVDAWLSAPFAGATRFLRRNKELDQL